MLDAAAAGVRLLSSRVAVVPVMQIFFCVYCPILLSANPKPDRLISILASRHFHHFVFKHRPIPYARRSVPRVYCRDRSITSADAAVRLAFGVFLRVAFPKWQHCKSLEALSTRTACVSCPRRSTPLHGPIIPGNRNSRKLSAFPPLPSSDCKQGKTDPGQERDGEKDGEEDGAEFGDP